MLLLLVDKLLQEQVTVVLLAHVLDLEVAVLLHEISILVIDFLRDLCHGLQMIVELLLFLFEVVLIFLFLLSLLL